MYNCGMETTTEKPPRRKGPVPGPPTVAVTVRLEYEQAEWGKRQQGGLSELLRRLLREAKEKAEAETEKTV